MAALDQGKALLEKDSLKLFKEALDTTVSALEAAPNSPFGEAHAVRAEIEIAWSEALTDSSSLLEDKAQRADDEKVKAEANAAAEKAKTEAKAHLKAALEATQAGFKADPKSTDVAVALLDYYRVNKADSNFRKQLKKTAELKADEGKVALVEGLKLLGEDEGAEKALPKLKTAQAAYAGSARVQYRIARAYLLLKNEPEALKALQETLKLSGNHERAQAALGDLQAQQQQNGGGEQPPAPPPEPEKKK
jgi:predicted Zn-dependent protease